VHLVSAFLLAEPEPLNDVVLEYTKGIRFPMVEIAIGHIVTAQLNTQWVRGALSMLGITG
jgi:hypothetical protein